MDWTRLVDALELLLVLVRALRAELKARERPQSATEAQAPEQAP